MPATRRRIRWGRLGACGFAVFAGVVVFGAIYLGRQPSIVPPESPEIVAERSNQHELYEEVVKAADAAGVEAREDPESLPFNPETWWQLPNDIAELDYNDPATVSRAKRAAAELHAARGTRSASQFYIEKDPEGEWVQTYRRLGLMGKTVLANAYHSQLRGGPANESLEQILDVLWLSRALAVDGLGWGTDLSRSSLVVLTALMRNAELDPATLESAMAELRTYSSVEQSVPDKLTEWLRYAEQSSAYHGRESGRLGALDAWWKGMHRRRYTRQHMQELYDLANLDTAAFLKRYRDAWIPPGDEAKWLVDPRSVLALHVGYAHAITVERGLRLAVHIELYRARHKTYPTTLADIVREFPDAEVTDAFGDQPFVYATVDDDYLLYSLSADGLDNLSGMEKQWHDIYIHTPRVRFDDIVPPDPPEIAACRKSAGNAYFMLLEAYALLPREPINTRPEDAWWRCDLGSLLSDPARPTWWGKAGPAIDKVREALKKSRLLCPRLKEREDVGLDTMAVNEPEFFGLLNRLLTANALHECMTRRDSAGALALSLDALRLCHMAMRDDGTSLYSQVTALEEACQVFAQVLHHAPQTDGALISILGEIRALDFACRPLTECVLDGVRYEIALMRGGEWWNALDKRRFLKQHVREWIQSHEAEPCEMASVPGQSIPGGSWFALPDPVWLFVERQQTMALQQGLDVVVHLELYRAYHGTYPESLDALAAEFPDVAPAVEFCGRPFEYGVENNDYSLACLPPRHTEAQEGDDAARYRWRIHTPSLFQWPKKAA